MEPPFGEAPVVLVPFLAMERVITTQRGDGFTMTWYVLKGDKGAVQFIYLSSPRHDYYQPIELGVHRPSGDGLTCDDVPGGLCCYSGSYVRAKNLLTATQVSGDPEVVWRHLQQVYDDAF